jgi:tetratricopeptide (TPR) repeat protein
LSGNKEPEASVYLELGSSHELAGNTSKAIETYILAKNQALKSREGELVRLSDCYIARNYFKLGDLNQAEKILSTVIESTEPTPNGNMPTSHQFATGELAKIFSATDRNKMAISILYNASMTPYDDSSTYTTVTLFMQLGTCLIAEGDNDAGLTFLHRCLDLIDDDLYIQGVAIAGILANTYVNLGDLKKAALFSELSVKLIDELGNNEPFQKATSRESRAIYFFALGDIEEAKKFASESAHWYARVNIPLNNNLNNILNHR